ncbi:26S proteasome subunit P45 [Auriscalpium vulgare]|uniref:26S proteasome subunit P45 n=1 Tax=Auriscalpium vulgare TaxID=40419 RepID=A0ACB8RI45_9AGAM|nr:26S proteasome subunit P45 [Auriscalpium vulgare]
MAPKADWEKYNKKADEKEEKIVALDDSDIQILKTYGQGPYAGQLKKAEGDIRDVQKRINEKLGIKESDTGLASPNLWDLPADRQRMGESHPLQVARCTKIIKMDEKAAEAARAVNPMGALQGQKGADEQDKYLINIKQIAKFVVALGERVAPTDIEEGMRVGVDRNKYQIQIPLPPKIDASVTMMQVEEKPDVTYSDVGGCKEQIEKLREVVETPLLSPERFVKLGIDPPKGVLLFGPPGTGKTLCARAVANRTDATFIRVIGSELVQKYVGEGARMIRELFEMARSKKACIIFFDEVDAIGGARFDDGAGGDNEVQRTMLELINQLDGFDPRGNIKVLMATNRPDTLDPALLRPGRLDRRIEFSLPDNEGRAHILRIHARSMSVERDIRFDLIARLCPNTTGAELRSVATEAGMFAIRSRRKVCTERDFLDAVEKVVRQGTKFSSTPLYQYTRRTPEPAPPEVAQLLATYAHHIPRPLTLGTLLSFGRPLTAESVLSSVSYAQAEIPRRLATRIRSLEGLPFIVGTNPYIARALDGFRKTFLWTATYPKVKNLEENAEFAAQLEMLVHDHANDIPTVAKGFQECMRYMSPTQISNFLDAAIRNRIAVRLIAEQHIALTHALHNPDAARNHVGVVNMALSPVEMIRMCGSFVSDLCEATLGASPPIVINGVTDATFAYVPVHLEYILTEILKNSFRATVEHHYKHHGTFDAPPLPPVLITISPPPRVPGMQAPATLAIRVRDQGGGVSPSNMSRIFSYAFTTAGRTGATDDDDSGGGPYAAQHVGGSAAIGADIGAGGVSLFGDITGKGVQTGMGTIAGLGFGLPMSRLYARYFGGSLDLFSLDGWGSDVLLKLRCLDEATDVEI